MGAYYRRYLAAATVARLGDSMWLGVVLLVLARTHDAALAGTTLSAATLPTIVSAPLLGAWLDRSPRRRAALALNQVMLATCVLGLLVLAGRGPVVATLACAALAGLTQPLVTGGMSSMIPALVAPARVPRACAAESVTYDVAEVAGPALAGGIAAAVSPGAALLAQAGVALVGLALIARLPAIAAVEGAAPDLRSALTAGVRALTSIPPLRSATVVSVLVAGAGGLLALAIPELARRLTGDVSAAGLLFAVMALGSVAGAALLPLAQRRWATHRVVIAAALAEGIGWGGRSPSAGRGRSPTRCSRWPGSRPVSRSRPSSPSAPPGRRSTCAHRSSRAPPGSRSAPARSARRRRACWSPPAAWRCRSAPPRASAGSPSPPARPPRRPHGHDLGGNRRHDPRERT